MTLGISVPAGLELIKAVQFHKSFGLISVLNGIDLTIKSGEVHAILGENGAGKSTLVKLLSGFENLSSGSISVQPLDSEDAGDLLERPIWNQRIAEAQKVILIHQEFNLIDELTVAENMFLGAERLRYFSVLGLRFLDRPGMDEIASKYLSILKSNVAPSDKVGSLSVAEKQLVEIAKALSKTPRVLILDEPTAVLTEQESLVLFTRIKELRSNGVAVVFISHKLEEIAALADRVTIIRDGNQVGCYKVSELSKDEMAKLMVGRELSKLFPSIPAPTSKTDLAMSVSVLEIENNAPVSFELKKGEILGFAGLVGSGRSALMEALVGLRTAKRKVVFIKGAEIFIKNLAEARSNNITYLTKDRKGRGLFLEKTAAFNFSLFALKQFSHWFLDAKTELKAFLRAVNLFDVRVKDLEAGVSRLSGGNQQKLLIAKMLETAPEIIIFDEPTRGIDIGTKSQIYRLLVELTQKGCAIIILSSDMNEIIGLSHRVAVMRDGQLVGILEGEDINDVEIMRYATGLKRKHYED
ncbi:sugar ABC transporter ATP-binding protein [OM182 bacterium]|nr:sugar ABC transporter ATP-binding protein [OM182 bacterium]